jgi:hypothetical protein
MKDPKRSHFIQRFKFDFVIERHEDANRIQNELSHLFKDRLERMLDRILSEYDDPSYVTRLSKIEIDLGELLEGSLTTEVLMRFEKQFRRELQMQLAELKHPGAVVSKDRGERILLMPAQIEILTFFLTQGRLPIGAESLSGKVEKLFWELIASQPGSILQMLKLVAKTSPAAIKRLSAGFSDKLVARIYSLAANQNSVSISSYEKRVSEGVAKATGKSTRLVQGQLRLVLMRYLLVDIPSIFKMKDMEEVVAEKMTQQYGAVVAPVFKGRRKAKEVEKDDSVLDTGRKREAAFDLITLLLKGRAKDENPMALIEAWEYLVANDLPALKRLLAQQATSPGSLASIVAILPMQALRDFVQRSAPSIGMRLVQLAATVLSAHDLFSPSLGTQEQVLQAVYAALMHTVASDTAIAPSPKKTLEAIQSHLKTLRDSPKELLASWEQFDFLGEVTSTKPTKKKLQAAEKAAKEAATEAERAEEQRKARAALEALAEEERNKPPMTPEERKAAVEKARQDQIEAEKQQREWEAQQNADLGWDRADDEGDTQEDDAEFYRRGREAERSTRPGTPAMEDIEDLNSLVEADQLFLAPNLASGEALADVLMHYLATGAAPWWAQRMISLQVEIMMKALLLRDPKAVQLAFQRTARGLAPSRYVQFVERTIQLLEEKTFSMLLPALADDLAGFTVSIGLALEEAIKTLPEGMQAPVTAKEKRKFAYQHQLRYLMEYASSSPSSAQMLRYVLKQLLPQTGLSSRKLIEWIDQVVDTLVERGERRFAPIKAMLPKFFEGIEITPPTPHAPNLDTLAFQRTLLDKALASVNEPTVEVDAEGKPIVEEGQADRPIDPTVETQVSKPEGEEPAEGEEPTTPKTKTPKTPKPSADLKAKLAAQFGGKDAADTPQPPASMELSDEEIAALGVGEDWVIEVVKYYLLHGSLSPAATAIYTAETFREEVKTVLASGTRQVVQMVREVILNRNARTRLFALGEQTVLKVVTLLNMSAADKMLPYVQELQALFKGSSSPISPTFVFEHAIRHALALRTTFVPINYVKDFFEFVAVQPNVRVKEAIIWANRRLETSTTPLAAKIMDMLDVVDRIENLREERGRQRPPTENKPAQPPRIPKPFDDEIYVSNAGVGIIYLFLMTLFKAFNMLTEDRKAFVSRQAQVRAIHQIQYLCYKEIDSPEEKMVLAKLIVGWGLSEPLDPLETPLNEDDIDTCEAIMGMVCTQWVVMKNAGADYVRTTFLQRDGRLKQNGSNWILRVEENGLDILKNKIPWSTNPIRLPWLDYLIEVEWP